MLARLHAYTLTATPPHKYPHGRALNALTNRYIDHADIPADADPCGPNSPLACAKVIGWVKADSHAPQTHTPTHTSHMYIDTGDRVG